MNAVVSNAVLQFRTAVDADVAAIVALVESAYRGDASKKGWTTEADMLDGQRVDVRGVAEIVAKSGNGVLLAEYGGELLACCHLEKQGDACYFGMFAVSPGLQGGGVGKQMMNEAERMGVFQPLQDLAGHSAGLEDRIAAGLLVGDDFQVRPVGVFHGEPKLAAAGSLLKPLDNVRMF